MPRCPSVVVAAMTALLIVGCGTNPVTKKTELQFVSESKEIQIGQQNYAPARQSQGGDYVVDPDLTAYVREVGQKLAAVSGVRMTLAKLYIVGSYFRDTKYTNQDGVKR